MRNLYADPRAPRATCSGRRRTGCRAASSASSRRAPGPTRARRRRLGRRGRAPRARRRGAAARPRALSVAASDVGAGGRRGGASFRLGDDVVHAPSARASSPASSPAAIVVVRFARRRLRAQADGRVRADHASAERAAYASASCAVSATIIDGKADRGQGARARSREDVAAFTERHGRPPGLATVLVGEDPASAVYVGGKQKASRRGRHRRLRPRPAGRRHRASRSSS